MCLCFVLFVDNNYTDELNSLVLMSYYFQYNRLPLSGRDLGCSVGFDEDDYGFVTNGGTEDGYAAIEAAHASAIARTEIDGTQLDDCDTINFYMIFASDEDRDEEFSQYTYESTLQTLRDFGWTFHAILNNPIDGGNGIGALEESSSQWKVYEPTVDSSTPSKYDERTVYLDPVGSGPGKPDYSKLAFATDGVNWDLNKLREGGFTTEAFSEAFVNTTTVIIGEENQPTDPPSKTPTASPTITPIPTVTPEPTDAPTTPAPTKAPITAAPTDTPDVCSTDVVLTCIKNGSEDAFRAVLTVLLRDVLTQPGELDSVIPPLSDAVINVQVQATIQAEICKLTQQTVNYDIAAGGLAILQSLNRSTDPFTLAELAFFTVKFNVDLSNARLLTLLADLTAVFTRGLDPNAFVGELAQILIDALDDMVFDCLSIRIQLPSIPLPPPPTPGPPDCGGLDIFGICIECFSGDTVVDVQGQGATRMEALKIGDSVLTADGTYSKVYSFGHFAPKDVTPYLQIRTDAGPAGQLSLEITKGHMLYVLHHHSTSNKALPVPAGDVKVGDVLVSAPGLAHQVVTSIRSVSRRGAYAPFTVTGDVVVNGVVASNYIALPEVFQAHVSYKQQHWMQHAALQPIRAFCGVLGCENETYDEATGYSKPVSLWMLILHWAHKIHSPVCMSGFLYLFALPTLWLFLNMTHLVAAMLGYYVWKKTANKKTTLIFEKKTTKSSF